MEGSGVSWFLQLWSGAELSEGGCDSSVYREMGGSNRSQGVELDIFQVRGGLVLQEEHLREGSNSFGMQVCVCGGGVCIL